jgi:hypothetical protein
MPKSIPVGLTQQHVLSALADLDSGVDVPFGPVVIHSNRILRCFINRDETKLV